MGENKHIEELDTFAKKYIKEIPKETISKDFTSFVMQAVAKEKVVKTIKPKALISKKVWFIIAGIIMAVVLIPFKESENSLFNSINLNFSFLEKLQFSNMLESISVSNTVLYSVFFFGLMIIAQVIFLKNHFNKRFN